ncbi:prohibitin family protein [Candidatus Dependentiae bacterium]|nr:prohibitin family protein [Candidatus Dependentiae bacterium]
MKNEEKIEKVKISNDRIIDEKEIKKVSRKEKIKKFLFRHIRNLVIILFLLILVFAVFYNRIVINIYSGQAGVLWKRFGGGTVVDQVYGEGIHFISPLNKMNVYNLRFQIINDYIDVLTVNGLTVRVNFAIRFHPNKYLLGLLHKYAGPDYQETVVKSEIKSVIRKVVGPYKPEELYAAQKAIVEQIQNDAAIRIGERFVKVDVVMIKSLELPKKIKEAIEEKLEQQQKFQAYEFRLATEKKELERKTIEAEGHKIFQEKFGMDIDKYLKWRSIMAAEEIAKSPNAKVIITGPGKDGIPIILGGN